MKKIHLLYAVNFLAAFLLFQIELIIAKILLPSFGGSYLVWGACVVFFQFALLSGYIYVHALIKAKGFKSYHLWYLGLILLPLLFFPGRNLPGIQPHHNWPMVLDIFSLLIFSIGPVFFVLSTISLSTQSWLASSDLYEKRNPYTLYAVSNTGSLIGLLTYPFLVEYFLDVNTQIMLWRIGYLALIAIYLIAFFLIKISPKNVPPSPSDFPVTKNALPIHHQTMIRWFLLAVAASVMFLSVTNVITYEITPCPLLWIGPLAIYLLSFILTFNTRPFCPLWIRKNMHLILGACFFVFFLIQQTYFPLMILFSMILILLFLVCLCCQYELYMSRPQGNQDLTTFYLIISLGGCLGGILVTWIAPLIFPLAQEYLLGISLVAIAVFKYTTTNIGLRKTIVASCLLLVLGIVIFLFPFYFPKYTAFNFFALLILFGAVFSGLRAFPGFISCVFITAMVLWPCIYLLADNTNIHTQRNYYGMYTVKVSHGIATLFNGRIVHGRQIIDPAERNTPVSYYHGETAIGRILLDTQFHPKKIGVIGLGTGTVAAYGKPGQSIDYYELDPDIYSIAKDHFFFLKDSAANVQCIIGDARIELSRSTNVYDLLIIDAFSGDSVPAHLLTEEAFREYKNHLTPNGLLVIHTSNDYIDLTTLACRVARSLNAFPLAAYNMASSNLIFSSHWVIISWDETRKNDLLRRFPWVDASSEKSVMRIKSWKDSYSNIIEIFEFKEFLQQVTTFNYLKFW
ncbi:MAG: fused MFS/spermidine synthase [Candidatus Omnitrophica bacterium]|nr:fused MFS/spermidine synthase [Candidatus Omnitrophota bacterium]